MIDQIESQIAEMMERYVEENCKVGDREQTGLDPRAFVGLFYYNYDCIVIFSGARRNLEYYGGFEYIDSDYVRQYGDYIVYSAEADRVQEVLENLMEMEDA